MRQRRVCRALPKKVGMGGALGRLPTDLRQPLNDHFIMFTPNALMIWMVRRRCCRLAVAQGKAMELPCNI